MTVSLFSKSFYIVLAIAALSLPACKAGGGASGVNSDLSLNVEKYTLENGLDVVLHVDRSDPIVAINLAVHVGSARETTGRTGFAHLFEHLLFLDSENLGYGGLDAMNTRIGGEGTNGFTTHDMTQYFQAVPSDALEKVIWAEADKLGYFIQTVTQNVVDNEKQVVKNEKRQRVDNASYGHNFYVINKALYPEDHPYNWQVIGSLADLDAATLEDVQTFYKRWYTPTNVTVTLTGDFDVDQAKMWIEKYFAEIPAGDPIPKFTPRPGVLETSQSFYHEDNFATVPQLTMVWPTVEQYHPDSYALNILASYLATGKRAPLNEVLIDEAKLSTDVSAFYYGKEVSGEFYVFVTANADEDIDGLMSPLDQAFERFEANGISQADLDQIKTRWEVDYYDNLQSALGKAIQLGEYNLFTDDPDFYKIDLARLQSVTTEDVTRVYETYIKDRPLIYTSFVPKGHLDLKLDDILPPVKATVVEEKIVQGSEAEIDFDPAARVIATPTPSGFDRTVEPPFGTPYTLPSPQIWQESLDHGLTVFGYHTDETPLIYFNLKLDAGRKRGDARKPAVPAMTADLLTKGTATKTVAELEDAIKSLGSTISISAAADQTEVSGSTLARNFDATMTLVNEMLSQPRWDEKEFELLKSKRLQQLTQSEGDPHSISQREALKLRYPDDHIFHYTSYGSKEKLETVTLEDLKTFYAQTYRLNDAELRVVGAYDKAKVRRAFDEAASALPHDVLAAVNLSPANDVTSARIYFYDVPGAKQSVLRIERPSVPATHLDYPLLDAINFPLGGIYTSELMTELRVNKGYTYGIRSGFYGSEDRGVFNIRSSVRTNVTQESLALIRQIVSTYGPDFTQEDLEVMKSALLRGQALKTETLSDKLRLVNAISNYGYPSDYAARNAARIQAMTLPEMKALAAKYLRPDAMNYVVVGDAATQMDRLNTLGVEDTVLLNPTP